MFARGSHVPIAALAKDVWHNAGSFLLGEAERGCDGGRALPISPISLVLPEEPGGGILGSHSSQCRNTDTIQPSPMGSSGVCGLGLPSTGVGFAVCSVAVTQEHSPAGG